MLVRMVNLIIRSGALTQMKIFRTFSNRNTLIGIRSSLSYIKYRLSGCWGNDGDSSGVWLHVSAARPGEGEGQR